MAGMVIFDFVLGFTPFLAALFETLKAPKPVTFTSPPFFSSSVMMVIRPLRNLPAASWLREAFVAKALIKSCFFISFIRIKK